MLLMAGHELLGHGGACVSLGGQALAVDAMYFTCSEIEPAGKDLVYRAAGSIFNVLLAAVCLITLRRLAEPRGWLGYFLWVSAILNLLQSGSYVAFGQFIHPGMDWAMIVAAAPAALPAAGLAFGAGVGLIVSGLLAGKRFEPLFLTSGEPMGRQRRRLVLTPYLSASAVSIAASLFVPSDDRMMMLMGGIGNSLFFLWPMLLLLAWPVREDRLLAGGPNWRPRPALVAVAAVVTAIYVLVVSAGIELG
jgi:hypothetical protein